MRAEVNRKVCIGAAHCVEIAPSVFRLDEECQCAVVDLCAAPVWKVVEAAENCPTGAITVWDDDGKRLYP